MTPQEIFDTAVIGVLNQNGRSVSMSGVQCLYRAPDGKKCAAGHLIPDDVYKSSMEHKSIGILLRDPKWEIPDYIRDNNKLIRALQKLHDHSNEYIEDINDADSPVYDMWKEPNETPEHAMQNMYKWSKVIAERFGLSHENVQKAWDAKR